MSIRDTLNENQNVVVVVAVVVIVVALLWMFLRGGGGGAAFQSNFAYYKDTVTDEVFVAERELYPPIQSPAGNRAVRVVYYSCSDCDNEADRFIGSYEMFTDQAKAELESMQGRELDELEAIRMSDLHDEGLRVSLDGRQWFHSQDEQFAQQLASRMDCGADGPIRICLPPNKYPPR